MRTRSKINSDGSVTERSNLSEIPNTYAQGTKSLKQRYDENKGGYARALQSGKVVEKNGKKVVTDPDTGLEYEYKGSPEKSSDSTKQGLSKINNQIDGDQRAERRKAAPKTNSSVSNKETVKPATSKSNSLTIEERARKLGNFSRLKGETLEEGVIKQENENARRGAALDAAFMASPFAQQVKGIVGGATMMANKFSEKYRKARAQERKERGVK